MAIPFRWLLISIKRRGLLSVILSIIFLFVVGVMLYKWSRLGDSVNCHKLAKAWMTNMSQTVYAKTSPNREIEISDNLIVQHLGNRTEQRMIRLKQKVERISRKVKAQTVTLFQKNNASKNSPNFNVHIFYYSWYGNIAVEGQWKHWDIEYLPNWKRDNRKIYPTGTHKPPSDIGSNFYPKLGCYSSRDMTVIKKHMKEIRDAQIVM